MSQLRDFRSLPFAWLSVAMGVVLIVLQFAFFSQTTYATADRPALIIPSSGGLFQGAHLVRDYPMAILALGAILACLISWRLGRYGLARSASLAHQTQNQLLIQALNQIDLCVVIYGPDMRALHWNKATAYTFPHLLTRLERGAKLSDVLEEAQSAELLQHSRSALGAPEFAESVVTELQAGRPVTRVVYMADGRVFEALEFAFGDDHFASVRKDITRLHQQAEQIRAQNVRLSMVNERMQHFSEMAAHDLRAPLRHQSTLLNFISEDLQATKTDVPAEIHEYLDLSRKSLFRMQQLVEDLLEYARCDIQTEQAGPVCLADRLATVMELVSVPDGFCVTWTPDLPRLQIPEAACDIVLRNLICNAIKHHDRDQGKITISARSNAHTAQISVSDDGPGIPKAHQAKIFEPFQKIATTSPQRGSGLGLAMVSRTVASWNGEITVKSGPKRGSRFCFSAPLAQKTAHPEAWHVSINDPSAPDELSRPMQKTGDCARRSL